MPENRGIFSAFSLISALALGACGSSGASFSNIYSSTGSSTSAGVNPVSFAPSNLAPVTVTQPTSGQYVGNTFTLQAQSETCSGQPVAAMAYSIGNGVDSAAVNGTSIKTQVTASPGAGQILHVKSWGNKGAGCDTDVILNIAAPTGFDGSANIPNPPPGTPDSTGIQNLNNWSSSTGAVSSCPNGVPSSTCNPPNANYDPTVVQGPNSTGIFELNQSPTWATVIWGHSLLTSTSARNFIWDFYVNVNTTNYQSSELDLYTTLDSGQRFMMGSQCNRTDNSWDTWSELHQAWVHNFSIPCNTVLTPGVWHHVTFYSTVDATNNSYTYHVIRIDGTDYVLNQTQYTKYVGWPEGLIGVQVQLDANASGTGVYESVQSMQLYAW